jgi:phosphoglycerate kinase
VEHDKLDVARKLLEGAAAKNVAIELPIDHVCAAEFKDGANPHGEQRRHPDGVMGLDVGPKTRER